MARTINTSPQLARLHCTGTFTSYSARKNCRMLWQQKAYLSPRRVLLQFCLDIAKDVEKKCRNSKRSKRKWVRRRGYELDRRSFNGPRATSYSEEYKRVDESKT
jgi:hypothetical protein